MNKLIQIMHILVGVIITTTLLTLLLGGTLYMVGYMYRHGVGSVSQTLAVLVYCLILSKGYLVALERWL